LRGGGGGRFIDKTYKRYRELPVGWRQSKEEEEKEEKEEKEKALFERRRRRRRRRGFCNDRSRHVRRA